MAYTLIDEKRDVWSCKLEDLTFEEVQTYTKSLGDNVPLKELAFFVDVKTGRVVLNEDHRTFEENKHRAVTFLEKDRERQKELISKYPDNSSMKCFSAALEVRECLQIEEIVMNYAVCNRDYMPSEYTMDRLVRNNPLAFRALYEYGFIQGKRADRARRKK